MSEILIRCENVGKVFCRDLRRSLWYGLGDIAAELTLRSRNSLPKSSADINLRPDEFWGNQDISFEVRRGECVGLIGRNGAGKTTLLKMLNGLIKPNTGRIELRGRIGALIALGAGFNPVLTGRENVYVNGSILGLSKRQIADRFEEIVEFSGLSKFIDAPVQTYSSGMQVRLGFAVAVVLLQPDILLLDEVLAVGDLAFTLKCLNTVQRLSERCAVIFVSHQLQMISRFCTSGIVLHQGRVTAPKDSVAASIGSYLRELPVDSSVIGNDRAIVTNVNLSVDGRGWDDNPDTRRHILPSDAMTLSMMLTVEADVRPVLVKIMVEDAGRTPVVVYSFPDELGPGPHRLRMELGKPELNPGMYAITVIVITATGLLRLTRLGGLCPFSVDGDFLEWAPVVRQGKLILD